MSPKPIRQYTVSVVRSCVQCLDINVSACSEEEAKKRALVFAPNISFNGFEKSAEYTADMVYLNPEAQAIQDRLEREDKDAKH